MKQISPLFFVAMLLLFMLSSCQTEPVSSIKSFDGVQLSFDNTGKGKPALVFVHGWSNTRAIWEAQLDHFAEKYQVIAIDLPGFGASGNNRTDWSMEAFGKDISTLIQTLGLKQVVLVGFSMGAPVVIETAGANPDHVIGVVLVDNLQEIELQIPPPMAAFMDSIMMDVVMHPTKEKMIAGGFLKKDVDSSYPRIIAMLEGASHIGWRETLAAYTTWQNEACTTAVQAVKVPIVAINSDQKPTNVSSFRKYAPGFNAYIVPDVGHVIMWENTEAFNRLLDESIQEFLAD